ncbi:threonine--tRNA ligase, mitochondrial 1-like [Papaver somniferum]|uniref:threonine--tRNA ligase, mitochondrial 1-like n=1 Tax=Papaver somniferum TaxID=3469 RepID=UPI000E6FA938|nr:threonine--tRNA ligase, mitochondrial 1-like [Papaver somniferum]
MYVFGIDKQEFGLKPMNCPGHCVIFDHRFRSYRELPLRLEDFGVLHRNELSGALSELTSFWSFEQDDAHIFCRESQIKAEAKNVLEFVETWDKAEGAPAERKFQCATLQLEFQMPTRFKLSYSAEDEVKRERPVTTHRAALGSVEQLLAILLEHCKGKWLFWQSPRQAIIQKSGYYVDVKKIGKKIREAQLAQYNYVLVLGEWELGTVSRRDRDDSGTAKPRVMSVEELLKFFNEEAVAFH